MRVNVAYPFVPKVPSLNTSLVMDCFGIDFDQSPHVVAQDLEVDVRRGDVVYFTGPSGSGKSSLLRAVAEELTRHGPESDGQPEQVIWIDRLPLGDRPVVDALPVSLDRSLSLLASCGLGEAQLMLRSPGELSDGQRYRFRLALALASIEAGRISGRDRGRPGAWIAADEFSAALDRTLAKVIAYNIRRIARRTGVGFLLASTHTDIVADLRPDLLVTCALGGPVEVQRPRKTEQVGEPVERTKRRQAAGEQPSKTRLLMRRRRPENPPISFADDLWLSEGSRRDWPLFARWHYRSHGLAMVRRVTLLWHGPEKIGICVFAAPAAALRRRSEFFGLNSPGTGADRTGRSLQLKRLNQQLWLLARVVVHPTYRGAGIAADFIRQSCTSCPVPWIETLSAMGHVHPFFERAGFVRVGVVENRGRSEIDYARIYGGRARLSRETIRKSRLAQPVYYVFDNRAAFNRHSATVPATPAPSSPTGGKNRSRQPDL